MRNARALTRPPGASYPKCLSCHPLHGTIDAARAREQHDKYRSVLEDLGLDVILLPRDDDHPDACFVEDCAVVHGSRALITRMGAPSRRGEEGAVEAALKEHLATKRAVSPATVEGGDVVHLPDRLISGLSARTNAEGVRQMGEWLGVDVDTIDDASMMHLKSHVTYLGDGKCIATRRFANHPALRDMEVIIVPEGEEYAADTLAVGSTVLMPAGRVASHELVRRAGFEVIPVDVSEFEKCDGALTCLSIIF
jgi:dimethylargininase